MINKKPRAVFNYCVGWDHARLLKSLDSFKRAVRVCYISTQVFRMYLVIEKGQMKLSPYILKENQWIGAIGAHRLTPPTIDDIQNEREMVNTLLHLFYVQFPTAQATFYEEFPTYASVINILEAAPYGSTLERLMFVTTKDEEHPVDQADGVLTVFCDEGVMMVPYDLILKDGIKDIEIQVYRAKLHPDSRLQLIGRRIWDAVENLWSHIVTYLRWSNYRRLIDKI